MQHLSNSASQATKGNCNSKKEEQLVTVFLDGWENSEVCSSVDQLLLLKTGLATQTAKNSLDIPYTFLLINIM